MPEVVLDQDLAHKKLKRLVRVFGPVERLVQQPALVWKSERFGQEPDEDSPPDDNVDELC